jgi:phage tail-like protein
MADTGDRKDPLTAFLFALKIVDLSIDYNDGTAFFKSVGGLSVETEVVDQVQGGNTAYTHKLVGQRKFKNLVLKQGFTSDDKLWKWRFEPKRVDGSIYQLGADLKPVCRWDFKRGYPAKWDGPELDASKSDLAIETIEIAHEGIEMFVEEDQEEA